MPTSDELAEFYSKHFNYAWYEQHLPLKKLQAWHRWRRLSRVFKQNDIKPGNLLDIGCGHGLFVYAASRSGWQAKGLDYPSKATKHARNNLGLDIVEDELLASIKSEKLSEGQFDFITSWHCLEHVSDPINFLTYAARLLRPGGKILLAVPNAEAHGMMVCREDWIWCQEPFVHVIHFNRASLSKAAASAGLQIIDIWSRDNWDANRLYDEGTEKLVIRITNRFLRRLPKVKFWVEESVRLLYYGVGCFHHWFLGRECSQPNGSELLLLAELPRKA